MLTENFWVEVGIYVKEGNKILDLHNGGRIKFTYELSEIVGEDGLIYGLNLSRSKNKNYLTGGNFNNVEKLKPNFQKSISEIKNLDAILMRDFYFKDSLKTDPLTFFPKLLKKRGKLLIAKFHSCNSKYSKEYRKFLDETLPNFKRVFNSSDLLVYNKLR
ncbi:MAG: hypothetical protein NUV46_02665 [Nanoarchaeota archaeon]|nr:hypothetical protein [Nanoarchaeota archaeon]